MTEFGKYLRKLRIDQGENLSDMAKNIGVSASFLSAVETGKKRIPDSFLPRILRSYSLTAPQATSLRKSIALSTDQICLSLNAADDQKKYFAFTLEKRFNDISVDDIRKMLSIMCSDVQANDYCERTA